MKKYLIIILLVTLGFCVLFYFEKEKKHAWDASLSLRTGAYLLPQFKPSAVREIAIRLEDEHIHLHQDDQGIWHVRERADYIANANLISELLLRLAQAKISESLTCPDDQLHRLNLTAEHAYTVSLLGKDSTVLLPPLRMGYLLLPEDANYNPAAQVSGRYYALETTPLTVFLSTLSLDHMPVKSSEWLDKSFFKIGKIKSVQFTDSAHSFSFVRTAANESFVSSNPVLFSNEVADTASYYLDALTFNDVIDKKDFQAPQIAEMKIVAFDGNIFDILLYKKEGIYMQITCSNPQLFPMSEKFIFHVPEHLLKHFIAL